jgi:hypothetical protein
MEDLRIGAGLRHSFGQRLPADASLRVASNKQVSRVVCLRAAQSASASSPLSAFQDRVAPSHKDAHDNRAHYSIVIDNQDGRQLY